MELTVNGAKTFCYTGGKAFDKAKTVILYCASGGRSALAGKLLKADAVYGFYPANAEGDDIVLFTDETRARELQRFHGLRQQWQDVTGPQVEALIAGTSGKSLLIQVHRERPQAYQRLFKDPEWVACLQKARPLVVTQETRIFKPATFFNDRLKAIVEVTRGKAS